jgi:cell division protease FtsH
VAQDTQRQIDEAVRGIVMDGFQRASNILAANRPVLERGAQALLEQETLDEAAILALGNALTRFAPAA